MTIDLLRRLPGWSVVLLAVVVTATATVWLTGGRDDWRGRDLEDEAGGALVVPVLMSVRGGIEGRDDLVVVRPSGRYVVQFGQGRSFGGDLAPGELRAVAVAVARADLKVIDVTGPTDACCDLVYRLITYGPRSYEVTGGVPGRARDLIDQLEDLVQRGRLSLSDAG